MVSIFSDTAPVEEDGWAVLSRLKPKELVLGLNSSLDVKGQLRWKSMFPHSAEEMVALTASRAWDSGMTCSALVWMRPTRAFVDETLNMLVKLVQAGVRFSSILLDLESAWTLLGPQAAPYDEVTDYMFAQLRLLGLPIGITGYSTLRPAVTRAAILADFVVPQAYSAWGKSASSRREEASPGVLQARSLQSWGVGKDIRLSLPLFGLSRPNTVYSQKMNDDQSFTLQARACPEGRPVYLWSLKHLTKLPVNRQTRFIDLIRRLLCASSDPTTSPT